MEYSRAMPLTINELIALLVAIRDQHGNVDCRMPDDEPVRAATFSAECEISTACVYISDRNGQEEEEELLLGLEEIGVMIDHDRDIEFAYYFLERRVSLDPTEAEWKNLKDNRPPTWEEFQVHLGLLRKQKIEAVYAGWLAQL
jgi:hypothetical protein